MSSERSEWRKRISEWPKYLRVILPIVTLWNALTDFSWLISNVIVFLASQGTGWLSTTHLFLGAYHNISFNTDLNFLQLSDSFFWDSGKYRDKKNGFWSMPW